MSGQLTRSQRTMMTMTTPGATRVSRAAAVAAAGAALDLALFRLRAAQARTLSGRLHQASLGPTAGLARHDRRSLGMELLRTAASPHSPAVPRQAIRLVQLRKVRRPLRLEDRLRNAVARMRGLISWNLVRSKQVAWTAAENVSLLPRLLRPPAVRTCLRLRCATTESCTRGDPLRRG